MCVIIILSCILWHCSLQMKEINYIVQVSDMLVVSVHVCLL